MKCWATKNQFRMLLHTGSIDDDVAASTSDINRVVEKLQVSHRKQQGNRWLINGISPATFPFPSLGSHEGNGRTHESFHRRHQSTKWTFPSGFGWGSGVTR